MADPTPDDLINPLDFAAKKAAKVVGSITVLIGLVAGYGLVSTDQAQAVVAAAGAVPGVILAVGTIVGGVLPLVATLWTAFHVKSTAVDLVTPVAAPRDNDGNVLVPQALDVPTPKTLDPDYSSGPKHFADGDE